MSRPVKVAMHPKRRILTANLAVLLGLSSTAPAFADGPIGGSHVYRPAARVSRPAPAPIMPAMPMAPPPMGDQVTRIVLNADQSAATVELVRGKSAIIELPSDVRDLLVTNPLVADTVLRDKAPRLCAGPDRGRHRRGLLRRRRPPDRVAEHPRGAAGRAAGHHPWPECCPTPRSTCSRSATASC
jgi:hypothetical protein